LVNQIDLIAESPQMNVSRVFSFLIFCWQNIATQMIKIPTEMGMGFE